MARTIPATVEVGLIDRLSSPIARLQARVRAFSGRAGIGRLTAAVSDVGRAFAGLGAGLSRSMGRLGGIAAIAGLGAGGAGAALVNLTNTTARTTARLDRLSRRLAIPFDTLQELAHAANMTGVEFTSLTGGIENFGRNLGRARAGTGNAADAFTQIGLDARDMSDTGEALDATLRALAEISDPVQRAHRASQIFGDRHGPAMLAMINGGSEALAQMRQEAHDLGLVLSDDFGQQAGGYMNSLQRLRARMHGLRTLIAVELLPVFNDVVLHVTAWIDANRDLIATKIEEWVRVFTTVLTDLLDPTSDLRQSIAAVLDSTPVRLVRELVERMGALRAAMAGLTIYVLAPVAAQIVKITGALLKLMAILIAMPVVGWVMLAAAAVAGIAYMIYKHWDSIAASVSAGLEAAAGVLAGAVSALSARAGALVEVGLAMSRKLLAGIAEVWARMVEAVASGVEAMFGWLGGLGSRMFRLGEAIVGAIQAGLHRRLQALRETVMGWLSAVRDRFRIEGHNRRSPWDRRSPAPGHETDLPAGPGPEIEPLTSTGEDALDPLPPGADLAPLLPVADRLDQRIAAPVSLRVVCDGPQEDIAALEAAARQGAERVMDEWRRRRLSGETLH